MAKAGIPSFSIGTSVSFAGDVNYNASYMGQEVFNTEYIDRSGPSVKATYEELAQVRQDYGRAWRGEDSSPNLGVSTLIGAIGIGSDLASMSNSTFRLMSGANGSFSPKIYNSGWNGGSPARITTYGLSKIGTRVSTASGAVSTYMAYNDIIKVKDQPITWVDAGVGTVGLGASISTYFTGIEVPVVVEFVAIYGALRLSWDVGFYMGANYGPSKWYGTDNTKWFK